MPRIFVCLFSPVLDHLLLSADVFADLLLNPPERVELYTNRIVVRLHRGEHSPARC